MAAAIVVGGRGRWCCDKAHVRLWKCRSVTTLPPTVTQTRTPLYIDRDCMLNDTPTDLKARCTTNAALWRAAAGMTCW